MFSIAQQDEIESYNHIYIYIHTYYIHTYIHIYICICGEYSFQFQPSLAFCFALSGKGVSPTLGARDCATGPSRVGAIFTWIRSSTWESLRVRCMLGGLGFRWLDWSGMATPKDVEGHTAPCRTCGLGREPKLTNHGTSGYSLPIKLSNCTPAPIFLDPSQDSWWISSAGKAS